MPKRRHPTFATLAEIHADAAHLASAPYQRAGQWDLAQVCTHLADAFDFSRNGFAKPPPRFPRSLVLKIILRFVLFTGRIPAGRPLAQEYAPAPATDPTPALARLRAAIEQFESHTGPLAAHPFFGPMQREMWRRFHLIHSAHHLGFLIPAEAGTPDAPT